MLLVSVIAVVVATACVSDPSTATATITADAPAAVIDRAAAVAVQERNGTTSVNCSAAPDVVARAVLDATNRARADARRCGSVAVPAVAPLLLDPVLNDVAHRHASDMAARDFFAHAGSDGSRVGERADALGYDFSHLGENLAAGHVSVAEVLQGWLGSASHCETLMRPVYTHMGVACTVGRETAFERYWTVVFARPVSGAELPVD